MGRIYVGTCGFSYKDWKGAFYPEDINQLTMLPFYAAQFPVVELDFTYYAMPISRNIEAMVKKTPPDFIFCVKAHQSMTHQFTGNPEEDRSNFQTFVTGIGPLIGSGKLGCILAQFPWGFKPTPENESYLDFIREELQDLPVVIEFRNVEWVREETFARLNRLEFGFCCVDEPKLRGLFPPLAKATSDIGYVRFHGRNAAKWWKHREGWERYDYHYAKEELQEWIPEILVLKGQTQKTFVLFNNHHAGQAVVNARMLKELLGL